MKTNLKIQFTINEKLNIFYFDEEKNQYIPIEVKSPQEEYKWMICEKTKEIELKKEEEKEEHDIDFIHELLRNPMEFRRYRIHMKTKEIEVGSECLLGFVVNQFVQKIKRMYQIEKILVDIQSIHYVLIERIKKALELIGLNNVIINGIEFEEEKNREIFNEMILLENDVNSDVSLENNEERGKEHEIEIAEIVEEDTNREKKTRLSLQTLLFSVKYFKSIDDCINLTLSSKQYQYLFDEIKINPIEITNRTRPFFPNLQTLLIFSNKSDLFQGDTSITKRIYCGSIKLREYNRFEEWRREMISYKSIYYTTENAKTYKGKISNSVNSFSPYCFSNNALMYFDIPKSITTLSEGCFASCTNLQNISIPTTITHLYENTFYGCVSLSSVKLPSTLVSIGKKCFAYCSSLKSMILPIGLNSIGYDTFRECTSLTSLKTNEHWNIISNRLINTYLSNLCSVQLPSSLKSFNKNKLKLNELKEYTIPSEITSIGDYCFTDCLQLSSLIIPSTVKVIGKYAFENCPLLSIEKKPLKPFVSKDDCKQIEEWSLSQFKEVLFDSEIHHWNETNSIVDSLLFGKEQIIIIIQDADGNLFGFYLHEKIDSIYQSIDEHLDDNAIEMIRMLENEIEDLVECDTSISDPYAFLFTLKSASKQERKEQFYINCESYSDAFALFPSEENDLFTIGKELNIKKESSLNKCSCKQTIGYDYKGMEKALIGRTGEDGIFCCKRIQFWQMEETSTQLEQRIELFNQRKREKEEQQKEIQRKLDELSKTIMEETFYQKEIHQIEEWSMSTFQEVIFDSEFCDWKEDSSQFDKQLFGRENICIMIEEEKSNLFGCYINRKIDCYRQKINGEMTGKRITDPYAFIYSLKSKKSLKNPMKFDIKRSGQEHAFILYDNECMNLFAVGEGTDICIRKENTKNKCFCVQLSFDYQEYNKALVGKEGIENKFTVKRILVFQMKRTEDQQILFEKYQKEEEEKRMKCEKEQIKVENEVLEAIKEEIVNEYQKEIEQIEKWTSMKHQSIVFDSEVCDWNKYASTFDKHLLGKKNVGIIIELADDIRYGGFIYSPIDVYRTSKGKGIYEGVHDNQSFLFSFITEKPQKFDLKEPTKDCPVFYLCDENDTRLFIFGFGEIVVGKKEQNSFCFQEYYGIYELNENNSGSLMGRRGKLMNSVEVVRVIVIEFD